MTWKKYLSLFFLLLAYTLLVGHGLIPHHHHETTPEPVAHHHDTHHQATHHHHHHHHGDQEDSGSDRDHSHFLHSTDFLRLATHSGIRITPHHSFPVAVLPGSPTLLNLPVPPLLFSPPVKLLFYHSPHTHSSGLRAPPAFVA